MSTFISSTESLSAPVYFVHSRTSNETVGPFYSRSVAEWYANLTKEVSELREHRIARRGHDNFITI